MFALGQRSAYEVLSISCVSVNHPAGAVGSRALRRSCPRFSGSVADRLLRSPRHLPP